MQVINVLKDSIDGIPFFGISHKKRTSGHESLVSSSFLGISVRLFLPLRNL